jgi:hypothetical protein
MTSECRVTDRHPAAEVCSDSIGGHGPPHLDYVVDAMGVVVKTPTYGARRYEEATYSPQLDLLDRIMG